MDSTEPTSRWSKWIPVGCWVVICLFGGLLGPSVLGGIEHHDYLPAAIVVFVAFTVSWTAALYRRHRERAGHEVAEASTSSRSN